MERETGLEPANSLWREPDSSPQMGIKRAIVKEPRTTEADDVWQCEAAREYGPGRVWGQMSEALCRRAGKPVKERPMTVQRPSSGGKIRRL